MREENNISRIKPTFLQKHETYFRLSVDSQGSQITRKRTHNNSFIAPSAPDFDTSMELAGITHNKLLFT